MNNFQLYKSSFVYSFYFRCNIFETTRTHRQLMVNIAWYDMLWIWIPSTRYGPHFEDLSSEGSVSNITVHVGNAVYLNCRISLLQDKTVCACFTYSHISQLLLVGSFLCVCVCVCAHVLLFVGRIAQLFGWSGCVCGYYEHKYVVLSCFILYPLFSVHCMADIKFVIVFFG